MIIRHAGCVVLVKLPLRFSADFKLLLLFFHTQVKANIDGTGQICDGIGSEPNTIANCTNVRRLYIVRLSIIYIIKNIKWAICLDLVLISEKSKKSWYISSVIPPHVCDVFCL